MNHQILPIDTPIKLVLLVRKYFQYFLVTTFIGSLIGYGIEIFLKDEPLCSQQFKYHSQSYKEVRESKLWNEVFESTFRNANYGEIFSQKLIESIENASSEDRLKLEHARKGALKFMDNLELRDRFLTNTPEQTIVNYFMTKIFKETLYLQSVSWRPMSFDGQIGFFSQASESVSVWMRTSDIAVCKLFSFGLVKAYNAMAEQSLKESLERNRNDYYDAQNDQKATLESERKRLAELLKPSVELEISLQGELYLLELEVENIEMQYGISTAKNVSAPPVIYTSESGTRNLLQGNALLRRIKNLTLKTKNLKKEIEEISKKIVSLQVRFEEAKLHQRMAEKFFQDLEKQINQQNVTKFAAMFGVNAYLPHIPIKDDPFKSLTEPQIIVTRDFNLTAKRILAGALLGAFVGLLLSLFIEGMLLRKTHD